MRTQKLIPEEQIRSAREAYENGTDFTLAVEEEFAVLDPETLSLANRFEELQAAAQGTPLEEHLVGELIASEVEVRTGRCESFAEAAAKVGERRAQLDELAGGLGVALAAVGTHPWSPWQEQRIIDTPHYRRNDELLRYVVWRTHTFGLHVHVGIRGADRTRARRGRAAAELPAPADRGELLAGYPLRPLRRADRSYDRRRPPGPGAPRTPARVGRAGCRGARRGSVSGRAHCELGRAPAGAVRGRRVPAGDLRRPRPKRRSRPWLRNSLPSLRRASRSSSSSCRPS